MVVCMHVCDSPNKDEGEVDWLWNVCCLREPFTTTIVVYGLLFAYLCQIFG